MAGDVYREAWELYKRYWTHFVPIALAIFAVVSIAAILLGALFGFLGLALAAVLSIVGIFWLQGAIVTAVSDVRDGRADLSIGETLNRVSPRVGTLVGAGLLAGLAIGIGLLLFVAPGLYLLTIWSVIVPVIMLEQAGVFESFGRSRQLVSGHGWQVFGVIIVGVLISLGASIVLSIGLMWLPEALGSFLQNLIANTVVAPFAATAWTLMYYRLRGEATAEVEPQAEPASAFEREPGTDQASESPQP